MPRVPRRFLPCIPRRALAPFAAAWMAMALAGCGSAIRRIEPQTVVAAAKPIGSRQERRMPSGGAEGIQIAGRLHAVRVLGDGAWRFPDMVSLGPATADGRSVLAWTRKAVFVVDVATGQPRRAYPLPPPPPDVTRHLVAVAIDPAQTHVAALFTDGTLLLWTRPDDAPVTLFRAPPTGADLPTNLGEITARRLYFSLDGARLVAGMRIYAMAEKRPLFEPGEGELGEFELVLDIDGEGREALVANVAVFHRSRSSGCLVDSVRELQVHKTELRKIGALSAPMALTPDVSAAFLPRRQLVQRVPGPSSQLAVFNRDTGARVTLLPSAWRHAPGVSAMPDGSGYWYDDGEVASFAARDGTMRWEKRGYTGPHHAPWRAARSQQFAPGGTPFAAWVLRRHDREGNVDVRGQTSDAAGEGLTLTLLDARGTTLLREVPAGSATWIDGTHLLVARDHAIHVVDVTRGWPQPLQAREPLYGITEIDVADDGRIGFIEAGRAWTVMGDTAKALRPPSDYASPEFHRLRLGDGHRVFAKVVDLARGHWRQGAFSFDSEGAPTRGLRNGDFEFISRQGLVVASDVFDAKPSEHSLWDVANARRVKKLQFREKGLFANDQGRPVQGGRHVVFIDAGLGYTEFSVESVQAERPTRRIKVMSNDVGPWVLSDDGQFIAYAIKSVLRVASLVDGSTVFETRLRNVGALAISNRTVAVSDDGVLRVWTLRGKEIGSASLVALHDSITAVAIRPDESGLAIGTARGRLWELALD